MAYKDISGMSFGNWKVISTSSEKPTKTQGMYWNCKCSCGNIEILNGARLRAGRFSKGCKVCRGEPYSLIGCELRETYNSWRAMRERCYNKNTYGFYRYGGRGIIVCDEWKNDFFSFLKDMGKRPKNKTLDRIDNDGNYCPENCRWADPITQARNNDKFKLSDEQVEAIRDALECGVKQITLSIIAGVSRSHIANISTGHSRKKV